MEYSFDKISRMSGMGASTVLSMTWGGAIQLKARQLQVHGYKLNNMHVIQL